MITSLENPRVKEVVRLRRGRERRATGLLVAEGLREVERARAAGLAFRAIYVAPELLDRPPTPQALPPDAHAEPRNVAPELLDRPPTPQALPPDAHAEPRNVAPELLGGASPAQPLPPDAHAEPRTEEVSARVLRHMAYRAEPEGILAVVEAPTHQLPPNPTLVLVAVGVEKPGNLGAMARAADAAGADALLVADGVADPWNPNAIRASTGAVFSLPIVASSLEELTALRLKLVAAVVGAPTLYTDVDLRGPTALIVGAEDAGLDERWRAAADVTASIPMLGATADSLNASAAASVLLFEAVRQRG